MREQSPAKSTTSDDEDIETPKVYLVIIIFRKEDPVRDRIIESIPQIQTILTEDSLDKKLRVAFTSNDSSTSGFLIKTTTKIQKLRNLLLRKSDYGHITSPLLNGDEILLFELGETYDVPSSNDVTNWLQKAFNRPIYKAQTQASP